jgi:hypothetical protein
VQRVRAVLAPPFGISQTTLMESREILNRVQDDSIVVSLAY